MHILLFTWILSVSAEIVNYSTASNIIVSLLQYYFSTGPKRKLHTNKAIWFWVWR